MSTHYTFEGVTPSGEARFIISAPKEGPRREEIFTRTELEEWITAVEDSVAKWQAMQQEGDKRPVCQTMIDAWAEYLPALRQGMEALRKSATQ